jgi:hypothetical protein
MKDLLSSVFQRTPWPTNRTSLCLLHQFGSPFLHSRRHVVIELLIAYTEQVIRMKTYNSTDWLPMWGTSGNWISQGFYSIFFLSGMSNCTWVPVVLPLLIEVLDWKHDNSDQLLSKSCHSSAAMSQVDSTIFGERHWGHMPVFSDALQCELGILLPEEAGISQFGTYHKIHLANTLSWNLYGKDPILY